MTFLGVNFYLMAFLVSVAMPCLGQTAEAPSEAPVKKPELTKPVDDPVQRKPATAPVAKPVKPVEPLILGWKE